MNPARRGAASRDRIGGGLHGSGGSWPTASLPVARLLYLAKNHRWTLYRTARNLHWHVYDRTQPASRIDTLLNEVDADPTGIFWG